MPESMMQLPLVATFFLAACAANVRPSSDANVATDSQPDESSHVADSALVDVTGSDASTDDASEDVVVPPNARVIVTNTVAPANRWDSIEAMRLLPANPTPASGSWTQSSGTCEVDQQYQPAFEMLGSRLRFSIGRTEFFPTRTMDNRQEWRADMDAILPGNSVTITGENPGTGWTAPWSGSITVPPFVRVPGLEAQYRVRSDEAIRVAWTADALPNTSRVELRIYNSVFNEALRSFDQSSIRCEFPPTSGETSIRLSDHPLFRVLRDMRDNVVLTINVIERRILPYPNGSIEIIARSESALAPVIVRN